MQEDFFYPFDEQKGREVIKYLIGLIKERPDKPNDPEAKKEAIILFMAMSYEASILRTKVDVGGSIDIDELLNPTPLLRKPLESILSKARQLHTALAETWSLNPDRFGLNESREEVEHLYNALANFDWYIEQEIKQAPETKPKRPKKLGRHQNIAQQHYIEFVAQIFERARGVELDGLGSPTTNSRRKVMTKFRKLLFLCVPEGAGVQSEEALKKAVDRYLWIIKRREETERDDSMLLLDQRPLGGDELPATVGARGRSRVGKPAGYDLKDYCR